MAQRIWVVALPGVVAAGGCAEGTSPEAAADPGAITVRADALRRHVEALAHDSMCGRSAGSAYERAAAEYVRDRFIAAGLEPGTPDWFQPFPSPPVEVNREPASGPCQAPAGRLSQNVIGVIRGAGAPADEWVVIGAHYDHLGWRDEGTQVPVVYNGADDNASGTAVLIEVAGSLERWIRFHPAASATRRSILAVAFGAEEAGLIGSTWFASQPTVPIDRIAAMLNLDMVGRLRDVLIVGGTTTGTGWTGLLADANRDALHLAFDNLVIDRSDQFPFISEGVPAIYFFTGFHEEYHTPADDPERLNYGGAGRVGRLALAVLWRLASDSVSPVVADARP